ncbi:hypothetical protein V8C42DRAFT_17203 [Trichoderma barbatum]
MGKGMCNTKISQRYLPKTRISFAACLFSATLLCQLQEMVEKTTRWPDSQEENETARNLAFNHDMNFTQYLTQNDEVNGYTRLMSLLENGRSIPAICSAEMVHGTINWSYLGKGALVVDVVLFHTSFLPFSISFPSRCYERRATDMGT